MKTKTNKQINQKQKNVNNSSNKSPIGMSLTIDRSNEFIFKVFRIPKDSAQYFHDKGLWWLLTKIIFLKSFDTIFYLEEYVKLKGQGHSK